MKMRGRCLLIHNFLLLYLACILSAGESIHTRCLYYRTPNFRGTSRGPLVRKCCCHGEALVSGEGCVNHSPPSEFIAYINASYPVGVGFPSPEECSVTQVTDRWFIGERGLLMVKAEQGDIAILNYCIDDLLDHRTNNNKPSPTAVTCVHELKQGALPLTAFRTRTIGKCCARDEHFSSETMECVKGAQSNMDETIPGAPNNTQLGYTGVPKCTEGEQTSFSFETDLTEHVALAQNLSLLLINRDGECIRNQKLIRLGDYCLDYSWNGDENQTSKAVALMCLPKKILPLKSVQLTVFLSISIITLILTIVFLLTLQAKGILSHVPQVGMLAPRTQITYVATLCVSCIILATAMNEPVNPDSSSCWASAGFLLFSLLAGYFWNAALCLESLLIVMRIGSPGVKRYFLHSCWAYGIPGLITLIGLLLDQSRKTLACSTITPRVATVACFISDPEAQFLYLYLPLLLCLVACAGLLGTARHVRMSRLRRLELGAMHKKNVAPASPANGKALNGLDDGVEFHRRPHSSNNSTKGSNSSIARFGLSTRETHLLWWEAVCLALWSAATLFVEVIIFAKIGFGSDPPYNWHYYLWHVQSIMNALRGIGVFLILIVLPKDSRSYIFELISNTWERCGGKPLKVLLPPTRRSSTSTTATTTTTTTLSPTAPTDKERISLSSSDTQLSSQNASMSELHDITRSGDSPEVVVVGSGKVPNDSTDVNTVDEKHVGKTPVVVEAVIESGRLSSNQNGTKSPNKSNQQPSKPPRKSLENISKPNLDKNNSDASVENEVEASENKSDDEPKTPLRSSSISSLESMPPTLPNTPPPVPNDVSDESFSSAEIAAIIEPTKTEESTQDSDKSWNQNEAADDSEREVVTEASNTDAFIVDSQEYDDTNELNSTPSGISESFNESGDSSYHTESDPRKLQDHKELDNLDDGSPELEKKEKKTERKDEETSNNQSDFIASKKSSVDAIPDKNDNLNESEAEISGIHSNGDTNSQVKERLDTDSTVSDSGENSNVEAK